MKQYEGITLLSRRYANKKGITIKEAELRIKDMFEVIEESFLDDSNDGIQIIDFLTLQKIVRKAKLGRNPRTKVEVMIPERISIKAILGKKFDKDLNR